MAENESIGGFTPGELQFASWWVRNRVALRKAERNSLIVLIVLLYGYSAWGLLDAFVISYPRESLITQGIATNQQLLAGLENDRPQSVQVSDATVFTNSDGRVDMMSEVDNPNTQWWAEFNYRFNLGGEDAPLRSGYVLPGGSQVITQLGYTPQTAGSKQATVTVDNVRWHRLDPSVTAVGYDNYKNDRLNLAINNLQYTTLKLGTKTVGQTTFTLVNNSAFGFWEVDLVVRLIRGDQPEAVTQIAETDLSPNETRNIQITWTDNPPSVQRTEVIPQVNILDPTAFLPTEYFK